MEIEPQAMAEGSKVAEQLGLSSENKSFLTEFMSSLPGIDEATSFGEVLKSVEQYKFDLIVFDTAPTGHTLRLLNLPSILEKALMKLMTLKD